VFARVVCLFAVLEVAAGFAQAGTYSRTATTVPLMCDVRRCAPVVNVRSPDGAKEVRRSLTPIGKDRSKLKVPSFEVVTPKGDWDLDVGDSNGPWVNVDVLWSPDSQFVALSGNTNGYMNSVRVFRVTESGPIEIYVSREPFADMIRRFPPCRAAGADSDLCKELTDVDDLNFSAVDWMGEHILVLMGEVPSAGQYGGIMGQVMGYEVEIPSGRILRSMTAREFKTRWQHEMPFHLYVPDPPEWQK
jgi:hypothetical protein